jgi:alkylation response protein AidB-like acyl-CoA dehydrogenase
MILVLSDGYFNVALSGISYTRGGGQGGRVERLYREVRGAAIPGGSEEIMADIGGSCFEAGRCV